MVYFQARANHRSRKKMVDALKDPNGLVKDHKRVMDIELLQPFIKTCLKRKID